MSICQHTPQQEGNSIEYYSSGLYKCVFCSECWTIEEYTEFTEDYLYDLVNTLKHENATLKAKVEFLTDQLNFHGIPL